MTQLAEFFYALVLGVVQGLTEFIPKYLRNHTLYIFSVYCLVVGLLTIVVWFARA